MGLKPLIAGLSQSGGGGASSGTFPATTNLIAGTAVANTGADSGIDPGSVVTGTGTNGMLAEFTAFPGVIHDGISTNDVIAGLNLINAAAGVTGIIKGNGTGLFVPASPGTDYLAPGALPDGTTAVTQAPGDVPAAVASCEYVDNAISNFRNDIASFAALMTAAGITPVANGTVTPITSITTVTGIPTAIS